MIDLPKGHLSYSQIDCYLRCPQQYYRTYVLQNREPSLSAEAFEGMCLGATLEEMGNRKLAKGKNMMVEEALSFHEHWLYDNEDDVTQWGDQEDKDLLRRANMFLTRFWKQEEPLITKERLVGVEVPFEVKLGGVLVKGIIDLLERNYCWDYKVRSKSSLRYLNVDRSLQLSIYAAAMQREKVGYIVFVKDDGSIQHLQSRRDLKRTTAWLDFLVGEVAKGIRNESFMPCDPASNLLCSAKWCDHWEDCAGSEEMGI